MQAVQHDFVSFFRESSAVQCRKPDMQVNGILLKNLLCDDLDLHNAISLALCFPYMLACSVT